MIGKPAPNIYRIRRLRLSRHLRVQVARHPSPRITRGRSRRLLVFVPTRRLQSTVVGSERGLRIDLPPDILGFVYLSVAKAENGRRELTGARIRRLKTILRI